jgi:FAD/FMN-containing dehydrogenase
MHLDEIKKLKLHGDILQDSATIEKYSHDASLFEVKPEIVIFPQSSEDIQKLVRYIDEVKAKDPSISITARAAGTCMSGGSLNTSIIIDTTKYMNHVKEIGNDYVVAEPGMFYRDFEKKT